MSIDEQKNMKVELERCFIDLRREFDIIMLEKCGHLNFE